MMIITAHIETIHTRQRQIMNRKGRLPETIRAGLHFLCRKQYSNSRGSTTSEANKDFMGAYSAMLALIVAFKHRFIEIRIGNDRITIGKTPEGDIKQVELSSYNLKTTHQVLLSDCSFSPIGAQKSELYSCTHSCEIESE